jgi:hypothetical protein
MRVQILVLTLAGLTAMGCSAQTEEDTSSTGESQDQLLAGRRISEAETAQLLRSAGFPESVVPKMVCTAKWESSFYERATNRNGNGSIDRGLFQINSIHLGRAGCPSSGEALFNASTNAKCAYQIYKSQGSNAWYGYKAHRSECDNYRLKSGAAPGASSGGADDGDDDSSAGCFSSTLGARVAAHACVQSASNGVWYQCVGGLWERGVTGNHGPAGACTSSHPL